MDNVTPNHAPRRSEWWHLLRVIVIVVGIGLAPLFFLEMFRNVTDLLRSALGPTSWTVPAATEGCFLFLFLLDLLLLLARKPLGWLRYAPFAFAVISLALNIAGGHGHPLPMLGLAAVTLAFFIPLIAVEQAVRSMSVTDKEVRAAEEMKAAMRHATDLVRSYTGWRRWHAPSLLRIQIRHHRPPASVVKAVADGAGGVGAVAWEEPVEKWVIHSLTKNAKMAAMLAAEQTAIAATFAPTGDATDGPTGRPTAAVSGRPTAGPTRRTRRPRQKPPTNWRDKAAGFETENPDITAAELAAKCGVTERSIERWRADRRADAGRDSAEPATRRETLAVLASPVAEEQG